MLGALGQSGRRLRPPSSHMRSARLQATGNRLKTSGGRQRASPSS